MTTEDYVSYSLALALKEAGFDWKCDHYWYKVYMDSDKIEMRQGKTMDYNNDGWFVPHCSAPHIYYAQKWLREKKGIVVTIGFEPIDDSDMVYTYTINRYNPDGGKNVWDCWDTCRSLNGCGSTYSGGWDSYEQALSAGIASALELIEKKGE